MIIYRKATVNDILELNSLISEDLESRRTFSPAEVNGIERRGDDFLMRDMYLEVGRSPIFLAEDSSGSTTRLVGYIEGENSDLLSGVIRPGRSIYIVELIVRPAWRERGVGVKLLDLVEKWSIDNGVSSVFVNVYTLDDYSRSLLSSRGYSIVKELRKKTVNVNAAPEYPEI